MSLTYPPIFLAQNTADRRRLVAAQSRSYSDAKRVFAVRISAVAALGLVSCVLSLLYPGGAAFIGGVGGTALLIISIIVRSLEKNLRGRAAAIQEEFDTQIFQIPWNKVQASHPSGKDIALAADRYRGGRDANWYDPTDKTHRPFDILICQEANLGWGATMHWLWGWTLVSLTALAAVGIIAIQLVLSLPPDGFFLSLIAPFIALLKEAMEQIAANFETWRDKRAIESKIADCWRDGMDGLGAPSIEEIRSVQNRIFQFRLSNPFVPDWLDHVFHQRNEAAMRMSVNDRNEQARRAGLGD